METKVLTRTTEEQKAQLEAMAAELSALSQKLAAFRASNGDLRGLVDSARGYAYAAAQELGELVDRTQPRRSAEFRRRR